MVFRFKRKKIHSSLTGVDFYFEEEISRAIRMVVFKAESN